MFAPTNSSHSAQISSSKITQFLLVKQKGYREPLECDRYSCRHKTRRQRLPKNLHITWFMGTDEAAEKMRVFPFITLFYCRLLSLVQMAKISIIFHRKRQVFARSFSRLEASIKKFPLIVKSIMFAYRSEAFVMPMLSN